MTTRDLLDSLEARGVRLGYRLTVAAPPGAIDAETKQRLADAKPQIVEAMARAEQFGRRAAYKDLLDCDRDGFDWALGVQRDFEAAAEPGESFALIGVDGEPVGKLSGLDRRALNVDWSQPDPLTEHAKATAAEAKRKAEAAERLEAVKPSRKPRASKPTDSPLFDNLNKGGEPT